MCPGASNGHNSAGHCRRCCYRHRRLHSIPIEMTYTNPLVIADNVDCCKARMADFNRRCCTSAFPMLRPAYISTPTRFKVSGGRFVQPYHTVRMKLCHLYSSRRRARVAESGTTRANVNGTPSGPSAKEWASTSHPLRKQHSAFNHSKIQLRLADSGSAKPLKRLSTTWAALGIL